MAVAGADAAARTAGRRNRRQCRRIVASLAALIMARPARRVAADRLETAVEISRAILSSQRLFGVCTTEAFGPGSRRIGTKSAVSIRPPLRRPFISRA